MREVTCPSGMACGEGYSVYTDFDAGFGLGSFCGIADGSCEGAAFASPAGENAADPRYDYDNYEEHPMTDTRIMCSSPCLNPANGEWVPHGQSCDADGNLLLCDNGDLTVSECSGAFECLSTRRLRLLLKLRRCRFGR